HVCIAFAGFYEFEVHGSHGLHPLVDNRLDGTPTIADVTLQPANEAHVVVRLDEDPDVEQVAQASIGKDQDAFDQDDALRVDDTDFFRAAVMSKVIDRHTDRLTALQRLDVLYEQFRVQRVGVVEVDRRALRFRQVTEVAIIGV